MVSRNKTIAYIGARASGESFAIKRSLLLDVPTHFLGMVAAGREYLLLTHYPHSSLKAINGLYRPAERGIISFYEQLAQVSVDLLIDTDASNGAIVAKIACTMRQVHQQFGSRLHVNYSSAALN